MEFNIVNQTLVLIMFVIMIVLSITTVGFFGLQHQKLLDDVRTDNIQNVNQTKVIIMNVTRESSNATKIIIMNLSNQFAEYNDQINTKLDRLLNQSGAPVT